MSHGTSQRTIHRTSPSIHHVPLLPWLTLVFRLALGAVMLWAGLAKATDLRASNASVVAYGLVAPAVARGLGGALPFAEVALGIVLIVGVATRLTASLAAFFMALYIGAIASAWARGLSIDCGCFGGGGTVTHGAQEGYAVDITRDVLLLGVAVFLAASPGARYGLDQFLGRTQQPAQRADQDAAVHEMVLRGRSRRRGRLVSLAAASVIVASGLAGIGAIEASAQVSATLPGHVPAGATENGSGLAVTAGRVRVDIYLDYLCPECRIVEASFTPVVSRLKRSHEISLVYHPIGFLDSYSSPAGYSSRAAAAAGCAADQGRLAQYTLVLYGRQPAEHGPGLSTGQLIAAGRDAGITSTAFASCVRDGLYTPWVKYASDIAFGKDVAVTPTVYVNGKLLDVNDGGNPGAELAQAVEAAAK
jgi:uncharacterized membrane protein YphA (DoxX/SURF4 family)